MIGDDCGEFGDDCDKCGDDCGECRDDCGELEMIVVNVEIIDFGECGER